MIPAYARPAHRRLRETLEAIAAWNEASGPNRVLDGEPALGIIASGVSYMHAREAAPRASVLKLGMTYPPPISAMRRFAREVGRCFVLEEGDPYLLAAVRAAGIEADGKPEMYRFGELNVGRVRRILHGDLSPEPAPPPGKPPELCPGCPHRTVFAALRDLGCIVAGDIGCYTLGVLPPFSALDTCVCMGAGITAGLGMRHVLPPEQARKVVSVIGDSTFVHSGITGLAEAVYNPPDTGHVVIVLDNGTTAMTGMQEHPGTGRTLDHRRTGRIVFEDLARSMGIRRVSVLDPTLKPAEFQALVEAELAAGELSLIIARRDCLLATSKIKNWEQAIQQEACFAG
jgi:indolepyruvate ferredoxin oxidoreductase alpha subunit